MPIDPISLVVVAGLFLFAGFTSGVAVGSESQAVYPESVPPAPPPPPKPLRTCFHECSEEWYQECSRFGVDIRNANLAVLGRSGAGKSSTINALLDLGDEDPMAAPVGVVETTLAHTQYVVRRVRDLEFGEASTLVIHDFPGCGTVYEPCVSYIERYGLDCFDTVLLVLDTRVDSDSVELARALNSAASRRVTVLRNKLLQDVRSQLARTPYEPKQAVQERIVNITLADMRKQFGEDALLFVADSHDRDSPDFQALVRSLKHSLHINRKVGI